MTAADRVTEALDRTTPYRFLALTPQLLADLRAVIADARTAVRCQTNTAAGSYRRSVCLHCDGDGFDAAMSGSCPKCLGAGVQ